MSDAFFQLEIVETFWKKSCGFFQISINNYKIIKKKLHDLKKFLLIKNLSKKLFRLWKKHNFYNFLLKEGFAIFLYLRLTTNLKNEIFWKKYWVISAYENGVFLHNKAK